MGQLEDLKAALTRFSKERDWEKFHTPKNLATALSVEVAELQEIFTWLTPVESENLSLELRSRVIDEVGDVFICLLNFCNTMSIDALQAAVQKLQKNEAKYPADKVRGSAKKYTDF